MFEFSAGSPVLCLVDTIGGRDGAHVERLVRPAAFTSWLQQAALLAGEGEASDADLDDARGLREAVYRSALALAERRSPDSADIERINALARGVPARPQWSHGGIVEVAAEPVRAALAALAADAVAVLAAAAGGRVRVCPECRMMFLDRSPAGKRRWCSSASGCGNRAKVRDHRARRSQERRQT